MYLDYILLQSPPMRQKKLPQLTLLPELHEKYQKFKFASSEQRSASHHHIFSTVHEEPANRNHINKNINHNPNLSYMQYNANLTEIGNTSDSSMSAKTNPNWSMA